MTLAEIIRALRRPILEGCKPNRKLLGQLVEMLELTDAEWLKVPNHDVKNIQRAGYLTSKAKELGWIRRCIQEGLLAESWNHWPRHASTHTKEQIESNSQGKSVRTIPAGAFEQNRRKH